jgi:hypothetical protein
VTLPGFKSNPINVGALQGQKYFTIGFLQARMELTLQHCLISSHLGIRLSRY